MLRNQPLVARIADSAANYNIIFTIVLAINLRDLKRLFRSKSVYYETASPIEYKSSKSCQKTSSESSIASLETTRLCRKTDAKNRISSLRIRK